MQTCNIFDMERVVSIHIHIFGRVYFNVLKIKKSKHIRLRHVTRLAHYVKHVSVYMYLTRVTTCSCSTYKFNKFQTKLKKYIEKSEKNRVVTVTKKINASYSEISYKLE
jgi:hypothetical protein